MEDVVKDSMEQFRKICKRVLTKNQKTLQGILQETKNFSKEFMKRIVQGILVEIFEGISGRKS